MVLVVRDPARFLACLWAQERALVASGLPPLPDWWRRTIERFYLTGKSRLVVRKGRRVFASTAVAPRLAVAEMLFGDHPHIPGTPPLIFAFLSVQRREATARLAGIGAILDVLGVEHDIAGQTIRVANHPAEFQVITASFRATVGGTVAFAWCDEVSSWNDDKTSRNPAEQVIGTLAPALATLPDAKLFLVSSPLSTQDYHAKEFDRGDTEQQCVAFGTTWDINPTLTEEKTRAIEPNIRAWTRAYAAQPVDGVEDDWFGETACSLAFVEEQPATIRRGMRPIFTLDAGFVRDYFGYAVVTSEPANDNGRTRETIVQDSGGWAPDGEPRVLLERLRDHVIKPYMLMAGRQDDTMCVHADQAEFYSLRDIARSLGITLLLVPWTGGNGETSKLAKFRAVRTAMLNNEVRIWKNRRNGELYRQFRSVAGVMLPSGNERIEFKRTGEGHCDELSAVVQGISLALEVPATAALPVTQPVRMDNPDEWRAKAIRDVEKKRAAEMKRSPTAVFRKAMGMR